MTSIVLRSHQVEHHKKITSILRKHLAYLDTSGTGCGKTVTVLKMAQDLGLKVLVICPTTLIDGWTEESDKYKVPLVGALSYERLRGTNKWGCKHAYLKKVDGGYEVTDSFKRVVEEGCLLTFDEAWRVKNRRTLTLDATHTLVKYVAKHGGRSKVALLTATPIDAKRQAENIAKLMGIITRDSLYIYDRSSKEYIPTGIEEALHYAIKLNPATADAIFYKEYKGKVNRTTAPKIMSDLHSRIFRYYLASSMEDPDIGVEKDAKDGYYNFPEKDIQRLSKGLEQLRISVKYDEESGRVERGNFGVKGLRLIELSKIRTMVRIAIKTLKDNPKAKVLLYVWFKESIMLLGKALAKYRPLVLNGDIKTKDRPAIIDKFQAHTTEHRLLISHPVVGGVGVDLDDTHGEYPRFLYMIPSNYFMAMHQTIGRIYRANTKSKATIRFIYAKGDVKESKLLAALARKSDVMRNSISMNASTERMKYPGEFDKDIEE